MNEWNWCERPLPFHPRAVALSGKPPLALQVQTQITVSVEVKKKYCWMTQPTSSVCPPTKTELFRVGDLHNVLTHETAVRKCHWPFSLYQTSREIRHRTFVQRRMSWLLYCPPCVNATFQVWGRKNKANKKQSNNRFISKKIVRPIKAIIISPEPTFHKYL